MSRDALIELLWPDDDEIDKLGSRLSVELSRVRRVLGGGVIADRSTVRLDVRAVSIDLVDLHRLIAEDELVDAIDLYRGDVLPEDTYDDWVAPVRDDTRVRFAVAAHRLAERAARSGDHAGVCSLASRILATDPYDESAHRRLIVALGALNRFGDARHAYEVYRDNMVDIGVAPRPVEQMARPVELSPDVPSPTGNRKARWTL